MTSLRCRGQANAPAALCWLRRVLDNGGAETTRVRRAGGAVRGWSQASLSYDANRLGLT